AKEIGDTNQKVAKERVDLIRLLLQPLCVILELCCLYHLHSALDATLKGSLFIIGEIMPGAAAQQSVDPGQRVTGALRVERAPIADIADDPSGNTLDRQSQIDKTGRHRTQRHLREARPRQVRALSDRQPAILFDGLDAEGSVVAAAGKD